MPQGYISIAHHRAILEELYNKINELKKVKKEKNNKTPVDVIESINDADKDHLIEDLKIQLKTAHTDFEEAREDIMQLEVKLEKYDDVFEIIKRAVELKRQITK